VLQPILAELITIKPEKHAYHPTVRKLFNLLVAPEPTGEEFLYVTGPLQCYALSVMEKYFTHCISITWNGIPAKHTAKIAAEAMAVICPVLEGPWELSAWVLVNESGWITSDYGRYSDTLTCWIFNVISNPILCPNPYLRYELLILISTRIKIKYYKTLQPQAIESVLFACAYLSKDYLIQSNPCYENYHNMDLLELMGL